MVSAALTQEEYDVANEIFQHLRRRYVANDTRSLTDCVRIGSRIVMTVERGYNGIVAEYQNDLCYRDSLEELSRSVPPAIREKLSAILRPFDDRFFEATREVARPLFVNRRREDGFWWFRVPRNFKFPAGMEEYSREDWARKVPELRNGFTELPPQ